MVNCIPFDLADTSGINKIVEQQVNTLGKKSILPSVLTCCSTILLIPDVSARSKGIQLTITDLSPHSALTRSSPVTSFDDAITLAPLFTNSCTRASPMPEDAPVIQATFPVNSFSFFIL